MTTRTQYMMFLMFWVASIFVELFLAFSLGFDVFRNLRGTLFGLSIVAILPASGAHLAVMRGKNLYHRWQVSSGKDVFADRDYEDDDGYLHITKISEAEKQRDLPLSELVSGVEQVENDWNQSNR